MFSPTLRMGCWALACALIAAFPAFALAQGHDPAGLPWEGSHLPFGRLPSGGTLTTIYNEQDVAIEGQLRNFEGQVVSRIVRTLDANGRPTSEKVSVEAPELLIPPELPAEQNEAQRKALGSFITDSMYSGEASYTYDPQGRMTGKERRGGAFGTEITRIVYNEHGDKTEEHTIRVEDPEMGGEFSEMRYAYQYDSHGNWIEHTVTSRYDPNEPFGHSSTYRRTLIYY